MIEDTDTHRKNQTQRDIRRKEDLIREGGLQRMDLVRSLHRIGSLQREDLIRLGGLQREDLVRSHFPLIRRPYLYTRSTYER